MSREAKICKSCHQIKSLNDFSFIHSKDSWCATCKPCRSEQEKAWTKKNPGRYRERTKRFYQKNREKLLHKRKLTRGELKKEAFVRYGLRCKCCGEDDPRFLTIDHVIPPKQKSSYEKKALYQWLKTRSYPVGFQTLCFNRNFAKADSEECPHNLPLQYYH